MINETIVEVIDRAKRSLDSVNDRIAATPNLNDLEELIAALGVIDSHYIEYCGENDADYDLHDGETYSSEDSPCAEFYIEADWWHRVSLAMREIANKRRSGGSDEN